jgi:hypothetical protein
LVSLILENDQNLLDEDFIDQVMHQYKERLEEMMRYVEGVISEGKSVEVVEMILNLPCILLMLFLHLPSLKLRMALMMIWILQEMKQNENAEP